MERCVPNIAQTVLYQGTVSFVGQNVGFDEQNCKFCWTELCVLMNRTVSFVEQNCEFLLTWTMGFVGQNCELCWTELWQMIVMALQGDRSCHMWIVADWICQDWSKWNFWIHASQSLHQNAFQTSSMCLIHLIDLCTCLHTMNNHWWTFMNNMTILAYYWIGLFMSWYSLSPQPSTNSIDSMVNGIPIETNYMLNHYNLLIFSQ